MNSNKSTLHSIFISFLLFSSSATIAQDLDAIQQHIKKKKYKYCIAHTTYINKESGEESVEHKDKEWHFNKEGQVVRYKFYDRKGNVEVDGRHTYTQDALRKETNENNFHIEEKEHIEYAYNPEGQLLSKTDYRDDKLLITYKYYYGEDDQQLDSIVWLDKHNEPELLEYFTYNSKGLKIEQREKTMEGRADGKTIFEYYPNGVLKDEILYDGFGNIFERMYYNEKGLLTRKEISYIDYQVVYGYEYNKRGILKEMTKEVSNKGTYERTSYDWSKKVKE